jgi:hypothetical protein
MNQPRFLLKLVFLIVAIAVPVSFALGQSDDQQRPEANYEITLNILVGSNEAGARTDLPSNLTNISKQLRSAFPYSSYRLANTLMGRVGNNGSFEYKSVANLLGTETDADAMSFMEWSVGSFRAVQNGFQAQSFRFGARVPVKTGSVKDDSGRVSQMFNYESIGLNYSRVGVPVNVPTLLGTLTLPRTNGTLFLVMTVTSADR